jgi:hypothetical protein
MLAPDRIKGISDPERNTLNRVSPVIAYRGYDRVHAAGY